MRFMTKNHLATAIAAAIVMLGTAAPAHAANADWQAQKDAYRTAITQYKAAKVDRHAQLTTIKDTFRQAIEAAKAGPAESRKAAVAAAKAARDAAVAALGTAPSKPIRPEKPAGDKPAGAPLTTVVPNVTN